MIQRNFNPKIKELIDLFKAELHQLPIDKAIYQAEQLGLLLRANEVGMYSLNDIESFLVNEFAKFLSTCPNFKKLDNNQPEKILFIATELYNIGGHTRLMERLATFLESKPDLLITKKPTDDILQREEFFFSDIYHGFECNVSVLETLSSILKEVLNYDLLVLNIHPEDIYAVVACGVAKKINKNLKIHFVNHADHTFSYGSSISDVWYEISEYGIAIDSMRGLHAQKHFLGIPIDIPRAINEEKFIFKNGDLILTAASAFKYKPNNTHSIMPLVSALLDEYNKSKLQVIGVNLITNYWWWQLKLKYRGRLKISNTLPYDEYLKTTSEAKLYIDSHPFPGGTAFAEQFLQGRLCSGLISSYQGYSPAEMLKAENEHDVISFIKNSLFYDFNTVYDASIATHDIKNVKARFISAIEGNCYSHNVLSSYAINVNPVVKRKIEYVPDNFNIFSFSCLYKMWRVSTTVGFFKYLIKRMMSRFH
ncbi:UNVERIFIED_CONTAM: hypothetical protein I5919_15135 [Aeromonas hydrophila]